MGYDVLSKENPALVFGSITGFGSTGPLAGRGGLDLIAQGFSGLMSITGEGPVRPPVKVGAPVGDTTSGMPARVRRRLRLRQPPEDRQGPVRGDLTHRGVHRPYLLAGRNFPGHGRVARTDGLGPSADIALPSLQMLRRRHGAGGAQPDQLGTALQCHRCNRADREEGVHRLALAAAE